MPQPFVFDNGGVTDALVFAEDAVGKRVAFPSHLKRPIREVVNLYVLTCQFIRQITSLEDNLPAVIGESELLAYVTLLAMA